MPGLDFDETAAPLTPDFGWYFCSPRNGPLDPNAAASYGAGGRKRYWCKARITEPLRARPLGSDPVIRRMRCSVTPRHWYSPPRGVHRSAAATIGPRFPPGLSEEHHAMTLQQAPPLTIRDRVRAEIARAWSAAIDAGDLPALESGERPAVEVEVE